MRRKNRKHSLIDKLPLEIKDTVDEMLKADFTYREVVDYIKTTGNEISLSSVGRYAANLNETIQALRMSQENFRAIMEETEKYPNLDISDGILRILSNQLLEAINQVPDEKLQSMDLDTLMRHTVAVSKAITYKKSADIKNKDILQLGAEQFMGQLYEAMATDDPELYKKVKSFIKSREESL